VMGWFRRSVAAVTRPFATGFVITISPFNQWINSRERHTSELLMKYSGCNNIWYWIGLFQILITTPPTGYGRKPVSSTVNLKLSMKGWTQIAWFYHLDEN
jgi:hypothetical protein